MRTKKEFVEVTRPTNVRDILDEGLLQRLLDSYCFSVVTGLAVCYPGVLPVNDTTIERVEAGGKERELFSKICREFRGSCEECEKACENCDSQITLKYYEGEWNGPKLYHCHLGLWDMTYPLYAGGRLVGVLFGGQIVVAEEVADWARGLHGIANELAWNPFADGRGYRIAECHKQVEEVSRVVSLTRALTEAQKNGLRHTIQGEAKQKNVSLVGLREQYEKFKDFGKTLEGVIVDLH